jgi:hypothetical protein
VNGVIIVLQSALIVRTAVGSEIECLVCDGPRIIIVRRLITVSRRNEKLFGVDMHSTMETRKAFALHFRIVAIVREPIELIAQADTAVENLLLAAHVKSPSMH